MVKMEGFCRHLDTVKSKLENVAGRRVGENILI